MCLAVCLAATPGLPAGAVAPGILIAQTGPPILLAPPSQSAPENKLAPSADKLPPPSEKAKPPEARNEPASLNTLPLPSAPALAPGLPGGAQRAAPAAEDPEFAKGAGTGVEVNLLQAPDPESVGLIDGSQGGFDVNIWSGTDRGLVQRLLPAVRVTGHTATARSLLRRLLLSRVQAPAGKGGGESLLKIRVRHLLRMGEVKAAVTLIRAAPAQLNDAELHRLEVEGQFYLNDNSGACTNVRRRAPQYGGSYWQQALAFCHSLNRQQARSTMIADLLREHSEGVDPAFFQLVEALAGEPDISVGALQAPNGLIMSMMRAASVKLPPGVAEESEPVVLRAVALSPNASIDTRLAAAERAESEGALSRGELEAIHASVSFDAAELADPTPASEAWNARSRALLIRAAAGKANAKERAAALNFAWGVSARHGGSGTLLRASIPILMSIKPNSELVDFAGAAGYSLFATGNADSAMAWYRLAEGYAKTSPAAADAWMRLWPLAQIATGSENLVDGGMLAQWRDRVVKKDGAAGWQRARLLYSLLDALGQDVGSSAWRELVGQARVAVPGNHDPALWHALRAAAAEPRIGETVLLALVALSGSDARNPAPQTLYAVISALRRIGLDRDARALALEAAVAAGV